MVPSTWPSTASGLRALHGCSGAWAGRCGTFGQGCGCRATSGLDPTSEAKAMGHWKRHRNDIGCDIGYKMI